MTDKAAAAAKGLQNIVVGQTRLSLVNGTEGKLIYVATRSKTSPNTPALRR